MTFVGKILVIIIMVFALFFLAISTVVYSTSVNWKEALKKQQDASKKVQTELAAAKDAVTAATNELTAAKAEHEKQISQAQNTIAGLQDEAKRRQAEITTARQELVDAQANAKVALAEAEARRTETNQLREILDSVQKQADAFKIRQTELNDEIRILTRQLETAKSNNERLRKSVAVLSTALQKRGLSANPRDYELLTESAPFVEGEVAKVDARNSRVEITVGSDDGLVPGHELYLYRVKGENPGYLGKIKLDLVDPDHAVGHVIGKTVQGKKIREGDSVATEIRPRSL